MSLLIKNLSKTFGDKNIFDDFSYEFSDTGLYIVSGISGVGKTTLLRIIAGLDTDFSGIVENGGIRNVSFMFQEYRLFPTISALKNTLVAVEDNEINRSLAKKILYDLGISESDMIKKPRALSGGMKQRISFVRAVMKDSPVLILDEPTKELDEVSVNAMLKIISEEAKKRTVILVTHDNFNIDQNVTFINL
jgi:NitT/TauT family transport system ATP-binding protein